METWSSQIPGKRPENIPKSDTFRRFYYVSHQQIRMESGGTCSTSEHLDSMYDFEPYTKIQHKKFLVNDATPAEELHRSIYIFHEFSCRISRTTDQHSIGAMAEQVDTFRAQCNHNSHRSNKMTLQTEFNGSAVIYNGSKRVLLPLHRPTYSPCTHRESGHSVRIAPFDLNM